MSSQRCWRMRHDVPLFRQQTCDEAKLVSGILAQTVQQAQVL